MKKYSLCFCFILFTYLFTLPVWAATDTKTVHVIVDKTAPPVPSVTLNHPGWTNQDVTATINGISDVGGAGVLKVEYSTDGGVTTQSHAGSSDFTVTVTTDGTHVIQARTYDNAGHVSSWASATAQIDKIAPSVNITGVTEGNTYYTTIAPHFAVSDAGSGLVSSLATMTKNAAPIAWANDVLVIQEGSYSLVVTATDNAGNSVSTTVNFILATPAIPVAPTLTTTGATSISVQCPAVIGADNLKILRDGVEIQTVSPGSSYIDNGLAVNSGHNYAIQSVNAIGTQTGPAATLFTLANQPDNLLASNLLSTSFTITWQANGNPPGTEYMVAIAGGESVPYTADMLTYTFSGLALGQTCDVNVKARNGNHVETPAAKLNVTTNQAPTLLLSSPTEDEAFSEIAGYSTVSVTGTVTDADNDNVTVTATFSGVTKSSVVNSCAGGKPFTLSFDVVGDVIPESHPAINVVADDGK